VRVPIHPPNESKDSDPGTSVRPDWGPQYRRMLALLTLSLAVVTPPFAAAIYWRYVNFIPSYAPALPVSAEPPGHQLAARAADRLQQVQPPLPSRWQLAGVKVLSPPIAASAQPLAEIRRAFALNWRVPAPFPETSSSAQGFSSAAELFAAESRLRRLQGDPAGALRYSVDAMELGCRVGQAQGRSSAQAFQSEGMEQAERCADVAPMSGLATQLARVHRLRLEWPRAVESLEIDRQVKLARFTKSLQEGASQTLWEQLDEAERSGSGQSAFPGSTLFGHDWETWKSVLTPRTHSLAVLDHRFRELQLRASSPVRDGYGPPPLADRRAARFDPGQMGGYRWEWARHNLALLETALAVRLFRLEHGHYPAQLREIEPERLPEIPLDIWDQPVVYRLRNGRPVIYSLARDGVNDGGKAANPYTFIEHGTGDAVWGKLCASDWPPKR